jgi:hypothetical protein
MPATRDDFLSDCDTNDAEAYQKLFTDLEGLARLLEDPDPADAKALGTPLEAAPLRLRIDFNHARGGSLRLQHPKLQPATTKKRSREGTAGSGAPAPLLWFFPTRNEKRWSALARVSAAFLELVKAGVKRADVEAYARDLLKGPFETGGNQSLKTTTAGEAGGIDRAFRWDVNRKAVLEAVQNLVRRVDGY